MRFFAWILLLVPDCAFFLVAYAQVSRSAGAQDSVLRAAHGSGHVHSARRDAIGLESPDQERNHDDTRVHVLCGHSAPGRCHSPFLKHVYSLFASSRVRSLSSIPLALTLLSVLFFFSGPIWLLLRRCTMCARRTLRRWNQSSSASLRRACTSGGTTPTPICSSLRSRTSERSMRRCCGSRHWQRPKSLKNEHKGAPFLYPLLFRSYTAQ